MESNQYKGERPIEGSGFEAHSIHLPDQEIKAVVDALADSETYIARADAARILFEVAKEGKDGVWPNEIPAYVVGRALKRLLPNNEETDEQNLKEILRGLLGKESEPPVGEDVN